MPFLGRGAATRLDKVAEVDAERVGDTDQVVENRACVRLLNPVDRLPVETRTFGERFLCQLRVVACGPDAIADGSPCGEDSGRWWGRRHPLNGRRIMIACLYRPPYILGSQVP